MPNTSLALAYLRKDEWTMGHGQCPDCCGCKPGVNWWTEYTGHKLDCERAKAIEDLGGEVEWKKVNEEEGRKEFVHFCHSISGP